MLPFFTRPSPSRNDGWGLGTRLDRARPQRAIQPGSNQVEKYICTVIFTRTRAHVLPLSFPFEHCMLRELMRTSLLIRDGLRKEKAANLHRQTAIATH